MVRVKDLPDSDRTHREVKQPDGSTHHYHGNPVFLYCRTCGNQYSATRGDYFMADPNTVLRCHTCKEPMVLATEQRRIVVKA